MHFLSFGSASLPSFCRSLFSLSLFLFVNVFFHSLTKTIKVCSECVCGWSMAVEAWSQGCFSSLSSLESFPSTLCLTSACPVLARAHRPTPRCPEFHNLADKYQTSRGRWCDRTRRTRSLLLSIIPSPWTPVTASLWSSSIPPVLSLSVWYSLGSFPRKHHDQQKSEVL